MFNKWGFYSLTEPSSPEITNVDFSDPSDCGIADGEISISATGSGTLEYSIDNGFSWSPNSSFAGLAEGNYSIQVRVQNTACSTIYLNNPVQLASAGNPPVIGSVDVVQTSACGVDDGSIEVTATGNGTLEYSIDGGANWTSSSSFNGLAIGEYHISVRLQGTNCTANFQDNPVQVTDPGNTPFIENVVVSNPSTCATFDGVITIVASGSPDFIYSIDGGFSFQSPSVFTGLTVGTYNIVVALPGNDCPVSTTAHLVGSQTCVDTVSFSIPANTINTVCLDPTVFNFSGQPTSAEFCGQGNASTVRATSIVGECVTVEPAIGFSGVSPDMICAVHCFNNNSSQCDTTYIQITVESSFLCDPVFPVDTVKVTFSGNPTSYCVPISLTSISNYDLVFQGTPLNNPYVCNLGQTVAYSYGFLPGGGFDGPYTLNFWFIDGVAYSGTFNNPTELTALMNDIDPAGFWQQDPQGSIIFGGDEGTQYGNMEIVQVSSGIPTVLMTNFTFQPQGFTVQMTNPGEHLLIVTDPDSGCSDTLVINAPSNTQPPSTETITLNTIVNIPTSPHCLDGFELPSGVIENIGFCGNPSNGSAPITGDSCVFYVPNLNFVGQDEFCVIVCDSGFPQVCDTTFFIVNVLPEVDTVFLEIPPGANNVDTCLSNFIIELPGPIDQASFCAFDLNELTASINGNCLDFSAVNNFVGISEVCVEFCSGGICDTTIVFINVAPPIICDEIFSEDLIIVPSVIDEGFFCIPISPGDIVNFDVDVDGNQVTAFAPCDFGDVLIYNYSVLPVGPYTLESWIINGVTFMGDFVDIQTLVDSMNVWDSAGNWVNNLLGLTINGGSPSNNYGDLVIIENLGDTVSISPDVVVLPFGSNLQIDGFGTHELIVTESNGCADTITINLEQRVVTPETLFFETNINTTVVPICANTSELLGDLQNFNFCGLPANGSVGIVGDSCVSYMPNLNYTGSDEFCLVVCDDYQPTVCDTFYVVVQTQLPTDTVFVDADDVAPFEECLDGTVLQLPSAIDTAFICGSNPAEVELGFVGNCVTIDLEDTFVGTTIACVVHCTDDVPPICDTTYLVIEFDGVFPCDDIFDPDMVNVILENNVGEVCLPVPIGDISDYTVLLDGTVYPNQLIGCDVDSVYTYFYQQVFDQGNSGPYSISWDLNGNMQTGTVNNMVELVNLMNGLDPAGNWILDPILLTISSSNDAGNYGLLEINHPAGNAGLLPNFNGIPFGTLVTFVGEGQHEVVLVENFTNCDDTLFINAVPSLDTLPVTTFENTPSAQNCIDTTGLPGNFDTMTVCGDPSDGSLVLDGNCFIYTPNTGFVGNDEACLEICDDQGNCETWIIEITVVPLCSQFNFFPAGVIDIAAPDCADFAEYCIPIELDSLVNFGVLDNGVPYTNFTPCNGNFAEIALDTGFHEVIVVHMQTQCADTLRVNVTCQPDDGCGIEALTPLNLVVLDCDSLAEFCVDIAIGDLPNFLVTDNSSPPTQIGPCSFNDQVVGMPLDTGFHELVFADTVKGCVDTFLVSVSCDQVEDSTINIQVIVDDSLELCLADYDFPVANIDSLVNICDNQSNGEAVYVIDTTTWCITIFGEMIGLDTFCFKAYFGDTCAVLTVNVDVISPCPDFFPDDQLLFSTSCQNDSVLVCLPVNSSMLNGLILEANGQVVTDSLIPCEFDSLLVFPYFELPSSGVIGPFSINQWVINGDTVSGLFNTANELALLMSFWDSTADWTVGTDMNGNTIIIGGNLNSTYGTIIAEQVLFPGEVSIDISLVFVPTNYGLEVPVGASSLSFIDTLNNCSETIVIDVICVETDTISETVVVNESDTICLSLNELLGNVISVENICEDFGGTDVSFEIVSECIIFSGLDPGADTACLVICDDMNICDTTILIVTAELDGSDTLLIAVNDSVVTGEGQVILIDVLQNDTFTTLNDFNVLETPNHGDANFTPLGELNYVPDDGYCDDEIPDSLTYEICNATGCDTATVYIFILCDDLEIFTGFSPNEDGKNDFFRIRGLQNYPDHHLFIYNRWGNLVHEATNYQSDWFGTWNGKDLPDGTYFYVLDLGNGDKPLHGYVQIGR